MDTDAILRLLQEVSTDVINPRFRSLASREIHEKNPGDLVTVADHEAEELITRSLAAAYPRAVVLGEEAASADPSLLAQFSVAEHAFTVDPVDGTKNFVHGSPDHAVMVAELWAGVPTRAWIWQPQHQASYVAERGSGAFHNGERLRRPPAPSEPGQWRGVTSRRSWIGRRVDGLRPLELTWVCCGVDYPQLVHGNADFVLYSRALPWDHAPGSLFLAEAGGYAGTTEGRPYDARRTSGSLLAAASREVYDEVRGRLFTG